MDFDLVVFSIASIIAFAALVPARIVLKYLTSCIATWIRVVLDHEPELIKSNHSLASCFTTIDFSIFSRYEPVHPRVALADPMRSPEWSISPVSAFTSSNG